MASCKIEDSLHTPYCTSIIHFKSEVNYPGAGPDHLRAFLASNRTNPKKVRRNPDETTKRIKCNSRTAMVLWRNTKLA